MISLSGRWDLSDSHSDYTLSVPFPGDIHSALLEHGLIPDPFLARNELQVQWVAARNWIATRTFELGEDQVDVDRRDPGNGGAKGTPGPAAAGNGDGARQPPAADRLILAIDTFDCVGRIEINGELVWQATNMFVPVRADITNAARLGTNEVKVTFESAEHFAAERAESLPYPVPHTVYPVQSMHRNLVRKVQCHSGWDWGPCLMVSGLYGAMEVRRETLPGLTSVRGVPEHLGGETWRLAVLLEFDAPGAHKLPEGLPESVRARVLSPDGRELATATGAAVQAASPANAQASSGEIGAGAGTHTASDPAPAARGGSRAAASASAGAGVGATRTGSASAGAARSGSAVVPAVLVVELEVESPHLWWPAGYGEQPLYTVEVEVGAVVHRFSTAFRTIELVNEEDDHGRSLSFRVNGRDIWAKGANWIPVDAFPSRQTDERYRYLLEAAVDANMNMLRIWGGGQYERDSFYDLCDELGILIWHDLMFSCALYPSQKWFLEDVREEVEQQVRRLMHHPSIALWCGNNENVGALGWFPESTENPGRYLIDYDRLNSGVVGESVRNIDPTRTFWPSSPSAGEGDFSDNWHDDSRGDMHYWSVWHEGRSFSAYREVTPRFCSEFGFQSFPSIHGIAQFTKPDQYNPTAPDLEHHQRHERGNTIVTETMSRYFRLPFDFGDFLYLSQVQQAFAIATAVDFWRSRRPVSMGALYWQLNDLWPVVSWSSIEYDGRYKLLHHEARRFFAPKRLICQVHEGTVEVWLANDTEARLKGNVLVRYLAWDGTERHRERIPVNAPGDATTPVAHTALSTLPFPADSAFVVAEWEGGHASSRGPDHSPRREVERGWAFLTEPKRCELQHPDIKVEPLPAGGGDHPVPADRPAAAYRLHCSAAPAFWVALESDNPDLHFSDGGFLMLPGETRDIYASVSPVSQQVRAATGYADSQAAMESSAGSTATAAPTVAAATTASQRSATDSGAHGKVRVRHVRATY